MIAAKVFQLLFLIAAAMVMISVQAAPATKSEVTNDLLDCIQCFAPPTCPSSCPAGTKCKITPASCHDCGRGDCVPIQHCIQCFAPPMCPPSCPAGTVCKITPASCHSCGRGDCVKA